jgi:hypothetical protein
MGKKNSKLKQETIDRLTKDTYCEYMASGSCPRHVTCMAVSCSILATLHDSKPRFVSDARNHGNEHSYCGLLGHISPCSLVDGSKLFAGTYCLSVQGRKLRQQISKNKFLYTLLPIYKASHIPDIIFNNRCLEQHRPHNVLHLAGI